jgi:hypothetical protein
MCARKYLTHKWICDIPIMYKDRKHELHLPSEYCIHCGKSAMDIFENKLECHRDKKVTSISHTRSIVRLRELNEAVRTSTPYQDPNTHRDDT